MATTITARFPGTCATTGRRYEAGTQICKAARGGWEIADADTSASPAEGVRLSAGLEDRESVDGFKVGQIFRQKPWDYDPHGLDDPTGPIYRIVAVGRTWDSCMDDYTHWATGVPATVEEGATLIAAEQATLARQRAARTRGEARRALLALCRDAEDRGEGPAPAGWSEHCAITDTPGLYGETENGYIHPDGSVRLVSYAPDTSRHGWVRLDVPEAADLARTAAFRRTTPPDTALSA